MFLNIYNQVKWSLQSLSSALPPCALACAFCSGCPVSSFCTRPLVEFSFLEIRESHLSFFALQCYLLESFAHSGCVINIVLVASHCCTGIGVLGCGLESPPLPTSPSVLACLAFWMPGRANHKDPATHPKLLLLEEQ